MSQKERAERAVRIKPTEIVRMGRGSWKDQHVIDAVPDPDDCDEFDELMDHSDSDRGFHFSYG
jgi:hypothetical protein